MDDYRRLLNEFQRDFPLTSRPFAEIADRLGVSENEVLDALRELQADGAVSRVGPVFSPRRTGASTLAALAVPKQRLESVARLVSSYDEVNHNYQREHRYNLWFVVTAVDRRKLDAVIDDIERRAELPVMTLPLVADYHIDLGFGMQSS